MDGVNSSAGVVLAAEMAALVRYCEMAALVRYCDMAALVRYWLRRWQRARSAGAATWSIAPPRAHGAPPRGIGLIPPLSFGSTRRLLELLK